MLQLILATKNSGKIKEVKNIFSNTGFEITSLLDLNSKLDIEENEETFEGNAIRKAEEVFIKYKIPVLADDSGIETEQLNGIPGVYSARYAGENATDEENNQKLLDELRKYPEPHAAKYVCCAVYYDGKNFITEFGEIKGKIIMYGRGTNGFGYDPLFVPDGYNKTMAELPPEVKNNISHRGQAFNKLKKKITIFKEII
ncbi:MAG: non-canonical purine NTP pyrophosphatase, RdgB/HAM1 family [Ignavibacteria bacterium RBG_16_34_14]|nr:MAG: non-canonical purine NTP pyrophosphatase, RdgB/HAM1 family [Ignavibacteria bacterium RBG_16_34_14]